MAKTVRVETALDLDRSQKTTKTSTIRTVRLSSNLTESLRRYFMTIR